MDPWSLPPPQIAMTSLAERRQPSYVHQSPSSGMRMYDDWSSLLLQNQRQQQQTIEPPKYTMGTDDDGNECFVLSDGITKVTTQDPETIRRIKNGTYTVQALPSLFGGKTVKPSDQMIKAMLNPDSNHYFKSALTVIPQPMMSVLLRFEPLMEDGKTTRCQSRLLWAGKWRQCDNPASLGDCFCDDHVGQVFDPSDSDKEDEID
jgi:hypothetical protein